MNLGKVFPHAIPRSRLSSLWPSPFSTQHSHSFFLVNIRLWVYEYIYRQVLPCLCVANVLCYTWHITGVEMVEGRKEEDIINSWFTSSPQSILAFTPSSNSHSFYAGLLLWLPPTFFVWVSLFMPLLLSNGHKYKHREVPYWLLIL